MAQVFKTAQAELDGVEIADYIARHSIDAALRFLEQLERTAKTLAQTPELGERCRFSSPAAAGMRVWQVDRFPNYLIFYRPIDNGVEVVRVLHGARNLKSVFGS